MKIKQQIFVNLFNKFDDKPFALKDIREQIWIAQGKNPKKFISKQGYYNANIGEWVTDKLLLKEAKNTYKLGLYGMQYSKNPNQFNAMLREVKKNAKDYTDNLPHNKYRVNFTHLIGRKIINVRHLNPEECDNFKWHSSPLALFLDDSTCLIPQSDDEGNNGGAMAHIDLNDWREDYIQEDVLHVVDVHQSDEELRKEKEYYMNRGMTSGTID
ncbi:MAG: hypothetical protein CMI60_22230 [Parvibaculum sp.]|nr:hypothetical protein [Parvibaculum sp.]